VLNPVISVLMGLVGRPVSPWAPGLHFASLIDIEDEVVLALTALVFLALLTAERARRALAALDAIPSLTLIADRARRTSGAMIRARQADARVSFPEAGRALIADACGGAPAAMLRAGSAIAFGRDAIPLLALVAALAVRRRVIANRAVLLAA
jgi:hypothetical protein